MLAMIAIRGIIASRTPKNVHITSRELLYVFKDAVWCDDYTKNFIQFVKRLL